MNNSKEPLLRQIIFVMFDGRIYVDFCHATNVPVGESDIPDLLTRSGLCKFNGIYPDYGISDIKPVQSNYRSFEGDKNFSGCIRLYLTEDKQIKVSVEIFNCNQIEIVRFADIEIESPFEAPDKKPLQYQQVSSLADYDKWISGLGDKNLLFRGVNNETFRINSSLSRKIEPFISQSPKIEDIIRGTFSLIKKFRKSAECMNSLEKVRDIDGARKGLPISGWEILNFCQNFKYGGSSINEISTILMDATRNRYIALYMACIESDSPFGLVSAFPVNNFTKLNEDEMSPEDVIKTEKAHFWQPKLNNTRSKTQETVFIIGKSRPCLPDRNLTCEITNKAQIREELINSIPENLFPDENCEILHPHGIGLVTHGIFHKIQDEVHINNHVHESQKNETLLLDDICEYISHVTKKECKIFSECGSTTNEISKYQNIGIRLSFSTAKINNKNVIFVTMGPIFNPRLKHCVTFLLSKNGVEITEKESLDVILKLGVERGFGTLV